MKVFIALVAVVLMANSAKSLKCHVGSKDKSLSTDCTASSTFVCAKITLDATKDTPAYSCLPEASLSVSGHKIADIKDTLDCKDAGDGATKGNYCYCKKDDCNDPKKSGASTLSLQMNLYITMAFTAIVFLTKSRM